MYDKESQDLDWPPSYTWSAIFIGEPMEKGVVNSNTYDRELHFTCFACSEAPDWGHR